MSTSREPIDPSEWGPPYNFGAIGGMPPGWTVRYHRPNEMFFILPDDDPERAGGVFCSPWIARRYARGYVRNTDSRSESPQ